MDSWVMEFKIEIKYNAYKQARGTKEHIFIYM